MGNMNYWYAPTDAGSQIAPRLPPELIGAVAAPWRSTTELEAIKAKAIKKSHYDMADAAHSILQSRKQQSSKETVKVLRQCQRQQRQQQDHTADQAVATVDSIWSSHVEQLQGQAAAAVRALQERHEDALTKLRLDQVARAHEKGIRPQHRSKNLLHLRRSESVLVAQENYAAAFRVKAHADALAASEASGAHKDWLLRCHGEQEQLLAQQGREMEALCKRLDARLREVERARGRDLEKLQRKVKVTSELQRHDFAMERRYLKAAVGGCLLNPRTTRTGRSVADAFPSLAHLATVEGGQQAGDAASSTAGRASGGLLTSSLSPAAGGGAGVGTGAGAVSGSGRASMVLRPVSAGGKDSRCASAYLGPGSSSEKGTLRGDWQRGEQGAGGPMSLGVRFAPTPVREAWAAESGKGAAGGGGGGGGASNRARPGSAVSAGSGSGISRPDTSSSSSSSATTSSSNSKSAGSTGRGSAGGKAAGGPFAGVGGAGAGAGGDPHSRPPSRQAWSDAALQPDLRPAEGAEGAPGAAGGAGGGGNGAPPSTAIESGTTGKGSGSSALTEDALRAINQAMGAVPGNKAQRGGANSLQTSSFKSNVPYAGGVSGRVMTRPAAPVARQV